MFQFAEGQNCTVFIKIGTKLRQKLEYRDQIKTKEMTPGKILTPIVVTATSLCHCNVHNDILARGNFFYFFKKNQK